MTDTLTALDATFLELEELDEGALMSIGGVMIFDALPGRGAPTVEELCERLGAKLGSLPRYSQRLSSARTGGLSWPRWIEDENFDIGNHVTHACLPAPGGGSELCDWEADFYSHRLDRRRPLWEMVLLEGLEHGRWALAHKIHHCLVDGVGSVGVIGLVLDEEPGLEHLAPALAPASVWRSLSPDPPPAIAQATHAGVHAAAGAVHTVLHPREALKRSRSMAELLVRDEIIGAPRTSINTQIGATRRFAVVRAPLAELRAIGRELGGSVNDVVLAACTTGLQRLLLARGEQLPRSGMRAMVPVSLRTATQSAELGNRVSTLFVDLPVAGLSPRARLREIATATTRLKSSGAAAGAAAIIDLAALAPPVLHAVIARSTYGARLFNVTITNVPGPQWPLYAFGARMQELHPMVPLAAEHAIGIAVFSYDGVLTFGINADRESVPDLGELAYGIEAGIEELRALAPSAQTVQTPEETRFPCLSE